MSIFSPLPLKTMVSHIQQGQELHRLVVADAGNAQHSAKRAIFALLRGEQKEAQKLITSAGTVLKRLQKHYPVQELEKEGSYLASLEEFVEASLLASYLSKGVLQLPPTVAVSADVFFAGLGDVPGELYRCAVQWAAAGNTDAVAKAQQAAEEIVEVLVGLNGTKYLRTKTDQARQAYHKLCQIQYDLSLRGTYASHR